MSETSANLIIALVLIVIIGAAAAKVIYDFRRKNYCDFCGGNCGGSCEGCNACKGVVVPIEDDDGSDKKDQRSQPIPDRTPSERPDLTVISIQPIRPCMNTDHKVLAAIVIALILASSAVVVLYKPEEGRGGGEEDNMFTFETYEYTAGGNVYLKTYYTDDYFSKPATVENRSLMTFALCLELSCGYYDGASGSKRSQSVVELLRNIGCDRVSINEYYTKESTPTSTDVAIGAKKVGDSTVLFVAINGVFYTNEFASNLMLGASGDHTGFSKAANDSIAFLKKFIQDNGITGKAKILTTGYSRGSAASNLMGAYLSDAIAEGNVKSLVGDIEITQGDVYSFGFEVPYCGYWTAGSGKPAPTDSRYSNIWYVTNPDDVVTYVPTADWGFCRYGNQVVLRSHDPTATAAMLNYARDFYGDATAKAMDMSRFNQITGSIPSMKEFNEGFVKKLFTSIEGGRAYYSASIEEDLSMSVYAFFKYKSVPSNLVAEYSGNVIAMLSDLIGHYKDTEQDFKAYFGPKVQSALDKSGCGQYAANMTGALYQIAKLLNNYCEGQLTKLITDGYVLTAVSNTDVLLMPHLPPMTLCYLILDDPNYDAYPA